MGRYDDNQSYDLDEDEADALARQQVEEGMLYEELYRIHIAMMRLGADDRTWYLTGGKCFDCGDTIWPPETARVSDDKAHLLCLHHAKSRELSGLIARFRQQGEQLRGEMGVIAA